MLFQAMKEKPMPSPFPGMDPYLEGSEWPGVHSALSVEIARQLTPRLPRGYMARTDVRFVVVTPEIEDDVAVTILPDASIVRRSDYPTSRGDETAGALTITAPLLQVPTLMPERRRHMTVEIRNIARKRLVTSIDILSPANKRADGYEDYLDKRRRVLLRTTHLMEIDLLRAGRRVPMQKPLPDYPYFVLLSRVERRPLTEVWPIRMTDRLPIVPVPLLPGDKDVPLDLQLALTTVYDSLDYEQGIDYSRAAEVPLAPPDAEWAMRQGIVRSSLD